MKWSYQDFSLNKQLKITQEIQVEIVALKKTLQVNGKNIKVNLLRMTIVKYNQIQTLCKMCQGFLILIKSSQK